MGVVFVVSDDLYQGTSAVGSNGFFTLLYGMISVIKLVAPFMVLGAMLCVGYFLFKISLSNREAKPLYVAIGFLSVALLCQLVVNIMFF